MVSPSWCASLQSRIKEIHFCFIHLKQSCTDKDMSSLQVFVEPVEHVSKSLFSTFDCEWVGGIISASKSMGNSWEDLDKVLNLQEEGQGHICR